MICGKKSNSDTRLILKTHLLLLSDTFKYWICCLFYLDLANVKLSILSWWQLYSDFNQIAFWIFICCNVRNGQAKSNHSWILLFSWEMKCRVCFIQCHVTKIAVIYQNPCPFLFLFRHIFSIFLQVNNYQDHSLRFAWCFPLNSIFLVELKLF